MNIAGTILEDWLDSFHRIITSGGADGAGGKNTTYSVGGLIHAVVRKDSTTEKQFMEKECTNEQYTFLVDKEESFFFQEILRRDRDGQAFRVTDPIGRSTPGCSDLDMRAIRCEKWELRL